ncbi:MAG TPA: MBL fold metallo-hydrolase, partial [Oscillatoriaceae cyanobacterium]
MRVHHLNSGTMCPLPRRLINGDGGLLEAGRMVCHVWAIEGPDGLVLVDTGIGRDAMEAPWAHLGPVMLGVARPRLDPTETVVAQLAGLGFSAADVSDIVLTHLDSDHAGALADFPQARVHVHGTELDAALSPASRERLRYRSAIWAHGPRWVRHAVAGD